MKVMKLSQKVPISDTIEFQVQYADKDPITLRGHYWYNQDSMAPGRKFPAIVEFNPYRCLDGTLSGDCAFYPWVAYKEYLCFRVDLQGSGNSGGVMTDEYTLEELAYCIQVINQIADHELCDGNVGMLGWSWSAINSFMVAAHDDCPAALKAVLVNSGTDDRYNDDVHYNNGAMLKDNVTWAASMWGWRARPPDPLVVGDKWQEMWRERLRDAKFWFKHWGAHQTRDAYWSETSVRDHYPKVKVPVNIISGYQDVTYCNPIPRVVAGLAAAGQHVEGLIGPWGHNSPNLGCPPPRIEWLPYIVSNWWDRWLKGVDPPPDPQWPQLVVWLNESREPGVSIEDMEKGKWVAENSDWEKRKKKLIFYLSEDNRLSPTEPQTAASVATSGHLVINREMLETGSWGICSIEDIPGDQTEADHQSLVFDSEPLAGDLDCFGYPEVKLNLSGDQPLTCLALRLCEVSPDSGKSHLVCYRFFNLCYRDGNQAPPRYVTPGEVFQVTIPLGVMGHTFKQGWRIRLALSTSLFPAMWPTPEIAVATVYTGPVENFSASTLTLPGRNPRDEDDLMPALFPRHPEITCVDSGDYISSEAVPKGRKGGTHNEVKDIGKGRRKRVVVRYVSDGGESISGGPLQDLYDNSYAEQIIQIRPDDPMSIVASSSSTVIVKRKAENGKWKFKYQSSSKVWTEQDREGKYFFRYQANLKTYIANKFGGYRLFEKRTDQGSIERQWL